MIINHNISAINAHRQLGVNQNGVQGSLEKLSSGLQINRAGDDAAGLAISEKMRGQIRGLEQASTNAQDGISLIQTAEGALNETHEILQRMRELAVQSSNDSNTDSDRAELQKEVDELAKALNDIGNNTEFNTKKLLDGTFSGNTFHVGANAGQNLKLSIDDMRGTALNIADNYTVNGQGQLVDAKGNVSDIAFRAEQSATEATPGTSFTTDDDGDTITYSETAEFTAAVDSTTDPANPVYTISYNDASGSPVEATFDENGTDGAGYYTTGGDLVHAAESGIADGETGTTSVAANEHTAHWQENGASGAGYYSAATDGDLIHATETKLTENGEFGATEAQDATTAGYYDAEGTLRIATDQPLTSEVGTITLGQNISSQEAADKSITQLQSAIDKVSAQRSNLGAVQNRLEHTINNLGASSENMTAAESRIRDVDYDLAA